MLRTITSRRAQFFISVAALTLFYIALGSPTALAALASCSHTPHSRRLRRRHPQQNRAIPL